MAKRGQTPTSRSQRRLSPALPPPDEIRTSSPSSGDSHRTGDQHSSVDPLVSILLSGLDVEGVFGRSARTLRRWEQRGHLTPARVGNAKFYRPEDIRRLIAGQLDNAMQTPDRPAKARLNRTTDKQSK